MKKICYVTTISLTLKSFVIKSAEYLKEHTDWDITVICDNDDEFAKSLPEGIRYIPVSMKRGISFDGISVINKLKKIFKEEKFDLVQYSTPNASLYVSIAAKAAKVPVRLYCQWGIVYVGFQGFKRKIFKAIEKKVCNNSTHIEPDSLGNLEFAISEGLYNKSKGKVIWNGSASGVDLTKFDIDKKALWRQAIREKTGLSEDSFVYGYVGRITGDKGINELLQAFKNLLNKHDAHLILVGFAEKADSVDTELYEWAEKNENVHFCGYSTEVEKYFAAMDVYVLPSYREGFGLSVIEAEAMGVPVIATDIPGPKDAMISGETGLAIKVRNTDDLHNAMGKLYSDSVLREKLGQNGATFAMDNFEQQRLFEYIKEDKKQLMSE